MFLIALAHRGRQLLTWTLIIFALFSLILGIKNNLAPSKQNVSFELGSYLQNENLTLNQPTLILFHQTKRCEMCLVLEKIGQSFAQENSLQFILIDMDQPQWQSFIEQQGLFTATLYWVYTSTTTAPL